MNPKRRSWLIGILITFNLLWLLLNLNSFVFKDVRSGEVQPILYEPISGKLHVETDSLITDVHCPLHGLQRCENKAPVPRTVMRGTEYWVMYNLVRSHRQFKCDESMTFTTHGHFTFFSHLAPLVERWGGPVSMAVYAPGEDFAVAMQSIGYLRQCSSPMLSNLVTFHVFFDVKHVPTNIQTALDKLHALFDCAKTPPWTEFTSIQAKNSVLYPINVARNIARETVMTHFVFPSDIELYPSYNVIHNFLTMIRTNMPVLCRPNPKVFVLSIFEVEKDQQVPANKTQLSDMLSTGKAVPFHKFICSECHKVPEADRWREEQETSGLSVFHVAKRYSPYSRWEPIYICTNNEPFYDERLSWNGRMDKMSQGYLMCNLNYDFMVLNNAFLVHAPGIKRHQKNEQNNTVAGKQHSFVVTTVKNELKSIFNTENEKCHL